jgi:hypothetical protein
MKELFGLSTIVVVLIAVGIAINATVVYYTWNWFLIEILNLNLEPISFWVSAVIAVIISLLFK